MEPYLPHIICGVVATGALLLLPLVLRRGAGVRVRLWQVAAAAAIGGISFVPLAKSEDLLLGLAPSVPAPWGMAAVAAVLEEGTKAVAAALVIAARRLPGRPGAGLVLGAVAGLGMAVVESISYHHRRLGEGWMFLPPEAVRLYGHLLFGALAGRGAGVLLGHEPRRATRGIGWIACSTGLHFSLDWAALAPESPGYSWVRKTLATGVVIVGTSLLVLASRRRDGGGVGDATTSGSG